MRVTHFISNQQFLTNNNMLLTRQIKSNNRIATQRRFDRASEDIVNGSKAMTIRREIRDIGIYDQNLSSAKSLFDAAEKNLTFIAHDNYIEVEERLVAAVNGTHDQMELDIYATELDEIAENMVSVLNHDISERELFGGASNGQTPFQIQRCVVKDGDTVVYPPDYNKYYDADGNILDGVELSDIPRQVTYNGIPVDFDVTSDLILPDGTLYAIDQDTSYTIEYLNEDTLEFEAGDPKKGNVGVIEAGDIRKAIEKKDNSLIFPGSKPIYVDIGLGIKYVDAGDGTYDVDPQTALDVSMNGAEITGCGIDIEDVETSRYVTAAENLTNGAATNSTLELTINGQPITVNLDTELPQPPSAVNLDGRLITNAYTLVLSPDGTVELSDGTESNEITVGGTAASQIEDVRTQYAAVMDQISLANGFTADVLTAVVGPVTDSDGNAVDITDGMEFAIDDNGNLTLDGTVVTLSDDSTLKTAVDNYTAAYSDANAAIGDANTVIGSLGTASAGDIENLSNLIGSVTYTDEQISQKLNEAIENAYETAVPGETLPEDVSVTCKDGVITINTGDTAVSVGTNSLGIAAGDIPTIAALDDDGNPVLTSRYSKNLLQLVLDSANALRRGDQDYVNAVIDRANTANNHILREITTLGAKQNSIDFYTLKNNDYNINLKERQNVVEGTDMENEVIEYEGVRAAYEAVLKMSSTILGSSIFDFI